MAAAATTTADFRVQRGQVFVPCQRFNWDPLSTFIVNAVDDGKAYVVIPFGGGRFHPNGRHKWVSLKSLHPTDRTTQGRERKTGYRLHTDAPSGPRQYLCGSCLRYFDREGLAVASYGPASSTCHGCMADIHQTSPTATKD
ncbi:hypothetical protein [Streptomyces sp.]|uniref:hypothetical protein n=1 Tax=Streptomyces sp. TaxID=1931 RepID=UPI002F4041F8